MGFFDKYKDKQVTEKPSEEGFFTKYKDLSTPIDPYKAGILGATYDIRQTLGDVKGETDTSGIRPSQYTLPILPKKSQAEDLIKKAYQPQFSESEDNMSLSRVYQQQNAEKIASDKINVLKSAYHEDGSPISIEEKQSTVKELYNIFDEKKKIAEQTREGIEATYLPLLNKYQNKYTKTEKGDYENVEYQQLSKTYQELLKKYDVDNQMADKAQEELSKYLPEITEIPTITDISKLDDEQLKHYFGEVGIDKSYIGKLNTQDNAEAAKLAYNQKQDTYNQVYSLDSPFPFHNDETQTKGNPQWVNEAFQKQGGYQVAANISNDYKKSVENYQKAINEYQLKIDEYNSNPTKEGYSELQNYKSSILDPIKKEADKKNNDLKRIIKIQEISYPALSQWEQKQQEQLNLDLSTWEGQMTAAFRSLSNKNAHIFTGLEQTTSFPERLFKSKDEYLSNRIATQNRTKDLTFAVPEQYYKAPIIEGDFDIKKPIESLKKVNWSNLVAKNLEKTAFSLEIAGITYMTGGGANAIIPVTFAMTYGDALYNAREQGLNENQASVIASFQSLIEGLTERISPIESKIFNPDTYTGGALKQLTKEQIVRQLFKELTGKEIKQNALDYFLGKSVDVAKKVGKATASGSYIVLQETAEELAGDPLNNIVNSIASNNIQGYTYDPITLETLKNTAITSASTMALMGLWGAGTNISQSQVSSYNLDLATKPDYYLSSLQNALNTNYLPDINLKNGQVLPKQEFYKAAEKNIKDLSTLYQINKQVIDNLEDKTEQANYLNLLTAQKAVYEDLAKISPSIIASLDEKGKKIIEQKQEALQKIQENINSYNLKAFENISSSKEERYKKQEEKVYAGTISQFTDEFINKIVSEDQIRYFLKNLEDRYTYAPTERMKQLVSNISEKLNNRLNYISNKSTSEIIQETKPIIEKPIQEEKTKLSLFEQEKEKINTSSKEELESYKLPKEIQGEERKQLIQIRIEREKQLEQEENKVTGGFERGQRVSLDNNKTNKYYTIQGEEDGKLLLKAEFEGVTETTKVSPEDIVLYSPREVKQEVSKEEFEDFGKETGIERPIPTQETTPSEDIEAKKADIERRRPTSYIRDSKDKKSPLETFRNEAKREWDGVSVITGDRMKNLYVGIQLFVEAYPEHKDLLDKFIKKENGTIGITNNNLSFVLNTLKKQGVTTESELGVKINAKYDAEIKALEQQPTSAQPDIEVQKADILQKKKERLANVKPMYHHTNVDTKDFNFNNFQRGNKQVSQFGDGLNASSNTTSFLVSRYGKPIQGEVNDADFVKIDASKTEKEVYEELKKQGYIFSKVHDTNDVLSEVPGAAMELFTDFQKSNPNVKGVRVSNHIIGNTKVAPFYVIYDAKSFYGQGALSKKIEQESNAELAALEQPKVEEKEVIIPSATEEELKAQEELAEIQRKDEEQAKEKAEKEAIKQEKEIVENNIKFATYNPFATVAPFDTDNKGIIEKISANSLKWLSNKLIETGKSLSDLGYYITVYDVRDFPKDNYFQEWKQYWENSKTPDDKRTGVVAIITNKEGEIVKFNENGEPDANGNWSIHQVRKNFKKPTDLSPERLKQWEIEKSKAEKLREYVQPGKAITIQSSLKQASPTIKRELISKNYQKGNYEFSVGNPSYVKTKDGSFLVFTGKKIGDVPNIAEAIYDYLNINNSEGLPDAYIAQNKEQVRGAFWNRMSFNETSAKEKTFPEVFAYTRSSLQFRVDEETGFPYITDKANSFKIEGRENFINFLNKEQLNLHKRAEYPNPLDVYYFKDGKFTKQTIDYAEFVANNFESNIAQSVGNPHFVFETAVKKVAKEPKVEVKPEEPKLVPPQIEEKPTFNFDDITPSEDTLDDVTDTEGLDRVKTLSQKVSPQQEKEAKEWFDKYLVKSGATFEDSREIANSTAFATWTKAAITLWKDGKFTDLYHEAWHDFTQMFLKPKQKIALYEEILPTELGQKKLQEFAKEKKTTVDKLTTLQKYKAMEELYAEDFYNYRLSGQKLILNQRPKRNTIFRQIYNYLKEVLTGKPNLERLYRKLASQKINKAKRDPMKALFGKLNKSIEGLGVKDSRDLYKAIDGVIANQLNIRGIAISKVFLEEGYLNKVYGTVKNTLLQSAKELAKEYETNPTTELAYTLSNLQYTLNNWQTVKEAHRASSKYLKVSKELIPDTEITDDGEEIEVNDKYGEARENINPKDDVAQYIIYLVASLPKYEFKKGKPVKVDNPFLPNVQDTADFGVSWGQLAKNLQGDKDYNSIYSKIEKLAKKNPTFTPLLTALPNPNKTLNRYELQLKASFVNAFSKPFINSKITSFEYGKEGNKILSRNAESTTFDQIKQDWALSIQTNPNEYKQKEESGQYSLNISKILDDFKRISKINSRDFLDALGITFSEATKESQELKEILDVKSTLNKVLQALKDYKALQDKQYPKGYIPTTQELQRFEKPVYSVTDLAKSVFFDTNKTAFNGIQDILEELMEIELKYSEKYHSDVATTSDGNKKWLHSNWSLQSQDYSLLNDTIKFPTYQDLIADNLGSYFNIELNPDANNIFLNSVFNLDKSSPEYGKRRTGLKDAPIQIELFDQNGVKFSFGENEREGIKTSKLSRYLALIADIPSFLTTGEKQHLRYGDKSTSRGTLITYPSLVKGQTKTDKHLPVDISDFNNLNQISEQTWQILRNSIISTLQITNNQTANNLYDDAANIKTNIKNIPFGKFDKALSKETKELLSQATENTSINIPNLVEKHKEAISKDLAKYFNDISNDVLNELNENTLVREKDIFPQKLLKYPKDQLIRAFTVNSWIVNSEHERLIFQDSRFYDLKVENEKKKNLREPFKRYSKSSSSGVIPVNDFQINNFFNSPESNSFVEKQTYDKNNPNNKSLPYVEEGIVNSLIVNDVKLTPQDYIDSVLNHLKNAPQEEQDAVKDGLKGLKTTDAMAVATFDFYRNLKLRIGEEFWTDESEKLYQKIARQEKLTDEDVKNAYLFFSPLKFRVAGRTFDENKKIFIPVDYKFAITPLLPTLVKGKTYEAIKNNMLRQNGHLLLFQSASKHSAITDNGKYKNLYNEDGTPFTGDYTFNKVPIEYFYEVVNAPDKYKKEIRFSTQLRTILFVNLFDNGKPLDYKKDKKSWDSLTETEKKKQSSSYRKASDFRDAIDNIISLRKEKLLKKIEAVYDEKTDSYTFNQKKLSELLEKEFENKELPNNIQDSIQTNINQEFKYKFDATIARDEIENTILSVIDNQLRKQNVYGESLIQVSSAGFENLGEIVSDETLPFYKDGGRTLPDGTKVTSAQKVKISLQGDFKKLLQHPDVLSLSNKEKITQLEALNKLLKDEEWLNKGKNRQLVTITGVRIPVQGLNSMEFMEVYEFFPTESGNIIAVAPELVGKSGGDFDWDKITSQFPHIYINNNGDVLPVTNLSDSQIEELYTELTKELKSYDKNLSKKELETKLASSKLISNIFNTDLADLIYDSFSKEEIPSKKQFVNLYKERQAENELISIMREVLEDPHNYINLVLPNATYMFEDIADERKNALQTEKPSLSDNYTPTESLNQHESNFVGKDALGIGAIANKFFPLLQQVGMYLNDTYITNLEYQTPRYTRNRFKHNETKDGNISVSGVWSVEKPGKGRYKISESFSQLMNGWLDVAKKDWIFYINGRKELAPTMLFHLMQGTHKDDVISFFNQPVLYDYIKTLNNYKNPLIKATNPQVYKEAKKKAIYDTLMKYIPGDLEITVTKGKNTFNVNLRNELEAKFNDNPAFFYGFVAKQLRQLADENSELFDDTKFDYNKFSIPVNGKLSTPTTEKEKLAQTVYFIQYLELEEQTKLFNQMRKTMNNDTSKASSLQYSQSRKVEQTVTDLHGLFPSNLVKEMRNNSTIAAFTHENTGIDTFIEQISKDLFDVTNHKEFNKFTNAEWVKPEDKNFIAFENKTQDDKEQWLKTFKNDFILYLYDNTVEDENDVLVAKKVYSQMQYNTALAHDMEQLKRDFPQLTENNLLLQYLTKDYSTKLNSENKPEKVNIKLRVDQLDKDDADILTEDFEKLLNFQDPSYTPEQQLRIKQFAENLAYFAYVQSGLNKTPYNIAKFIPQSFFAGKIQPTIKKVKEIFDKSSEKAQEIFSSFNARFRANNAKFYTQKYDDQDQPIITFNKETARYKSYIDNNLDIFGKKQAKFEQELKNKTSVQPEYQANEAVENPKTLFVFGDSKDQKATQNSAKITLVKKGNSFTRENQSNVLGLTLFNTRESYFSDEQFLENQSVIENQIKQIKDLSKNFNNIKFSENLFETSKLQEYSPNLFNFVVSELNSIFGTNYIPVEETIFEAPVEEQTIIEESPTIKEGVNFVFESNPELANQVYEALGLNQLITPNDRIVFGHPTIGKSYLKKQGENRFITLDDDYADEVNAFIDANRGSETRQEYKGRKPKEYNEFMLNLFDRLKVQAKKEGKQLFVSNTNILKERMSDFDKVINIPKDEFKKRFDARGATYGFEDWKSDINATIAKVPNNKVINTSGYLSDLFITPQQKQQALQQYSQYLDTIFPDSKVKDIVYRGDKSKTINGVTQFLKGERKDLLFLSTNKEVAKNRLYYSDFSEFIYKKDEFGNLTMTTEYEPDDSKGLVRGSKNFIAAVVNIQKPVIKNAENQSYRDYKIDGKSEYETIKDAKEKIKNQENDSLIVENVLEGDVGRLPSTNIGLSKPEQIHILGSKQDIEGFKQFVKSPTISKEVETAETIYSKLGNKTQSENVVIDEVNGRKPAVENKLDLKTFINYSGAAQGGDTVWENVGKEFDLGKQVNYRPEDLQRLTKEQLQEVENAYQQAVRDLGRKPLAANTFAGGLVRRDYLQAKAADTIFAISTIIQPNEKDPKGYVNKTNKPLVAGGTGYAVQMAINLGKPVYVFDQVKNKWFVWSNNNFVETGTPTLTQKFAGIGTREINENGKQAIRNVYQKTLNSLPQPTKTEQPTIKEKLSYKDWANNVIGRFSLFTNEVLRKNQIEQLNETTEGLISGLYKVASFAKEDLNNRQYKPFIEKLKQNGFKQVEGKEWLFTKNGISPEELYQQELSQTTIEPIKEEDNNEEQVDGCKTPF